MPTFECIFPDAQPIETSDDYNELLSAMERNLARTYAMPREALEPRRGRAVMRLDDYVILIGREPAKRRY